MLSALEYSAKLQIKSKQIIRSKIIVSVTDQRKMFLVMRKLLYCACEICTRETMSRHTQFFQIIDSYSNAKCACLNQTAYAHYGLSIRSLQMPKDRFSCAQHWYCLHTVAVFTTIVRDSIHRSNSLIMVIEQFELPCVTA